MRARRSIRTAALLVAVSALMVAGSGAASAASRRVAVSVSVDPDCFISTVVEATWSPNPDQAQISFDLTDLITGGSLHYTYPALTASTSIAGVGIAAIDSSSTPHRFLATATITD